MENKLKTVGLVLLGIFGLYVMYLGQDFAPGSYAYAEEYDIDYSEQQVIKAIQNVKMQHSDFIVPKTTIEKKGSYGLYDEPQKGTSHWCTFYFYYKQENQIVMMLTREVSQNETTILFVSINTGLDLGNWKDINNDFTRAENRAQKKKFEERILSKINENLEKNFSK
nr:hypothetical protein [Bacteroidota bacterium]